MNIPHTSLSVSQASVFTEQNRFRPSCVNAFFPQTATFAIFEEKKMNLNAFFVSAMEIMSTMLADLFETIENSSSVSGNKNTAEARGDISFFQGKCDACMKQKGILPIIQGRDTRRGREGYTLLHAAARIGNQELIKYLLKKGADVNAVDNSFNLHTPMMTAIASHNYDAAVLLAANGALLSCEDYNGENILHYFARANNASFLKKAVEVSRISAYDVQHLASKQAVIKKRPFPENYAPKTSVVGQVLQSYRLTGSYSSVSDIKKLRTSGAYARRSRANTHENAVGSLPPQPQVADDSLAAFNPALLTSQSMDALKA